jgi:hypothetical protein
VSCVDVEPARGDVGRDQQVRGARTQAPHHPVALLLGHAPVQGLGAVAAAVEGIGELIDLDPGAAEDDRRGGRLHVEQATRAAGLWARASDVGGLADLRRVAGVGGLGLDLDPDRVGQVALGQLVDARRHGRGEQHRLAFVGGRAEDLLDVLGEAHVEHLVGLVEHDGAQPAERQGAALEVVQGAAGRRDDQVHTSLQGADLATDRLAAVDGQHPCAQSTSVAVRGLGDLHRQLTGGDQHERLRTRALVPGRQVLEDRQRERRGLAGAGRGLAEHVTPRDDLGDGRRVGSASAPRSPAR